MAAHVTTAIGKHSRAPSVGCLVHWNAPAYDGLNVYVSAVQVASVLGVWDDDSVDLRVEIPGASHDVHRVPRGEGIAGAPSNAGRWTWRRGL